MSTLQETIDDLMLFCEGKKYSTIYADPPWRFQNRTGKVAPEHKRLNRYDTMDLEDIKALPISEIADKKCHLYLWVPNALLPDGLEVMKAWGFEYKGNIVWEKVRKDQPSEKNKETQEKTLLRHRILVFNFDPPDVLPSLGRQDGIFLLPGRQEHSG